MLSRLHIENYALIDTLDIEFTDSLTIITGETGAGKSIILGALGLLMGGKADVKQLRSSDRRIVVEASFTELDTSFLRTLLLEEDTDEEELQEFLNAIESDEAIILRREVSPTGRSRAFINEVGSTLKRMAAIASRLIDIHSQRSNSLMDTQEFRLDILDALAGKPQLLADYRRCFDHYASLRREVIRLRKRLEEDSRQQELIELKLEQLRELKPRAGEQSELENRIELLSSAEQIREAIGSVCALLDGNDSSALPLLHQALSELSRLNSSVLDETVGDASESLVGRLESARIEVADIMETLQGRLVDIEANPALLQKSEQRLEAIYAAEKRFGVQSDAELVALLHDLEASMAVIADGDDKIKELEGKARVAAKELKEAAARLSASRAEAADLFSKELLNMARPLGMPNLSFRASVTPVQRMTLSGADIPEFLCAFNKNQPLRPLSEIASGGEMSRVMLCVKAIVAGKMQMPTVIFDEIDTGVSGDIADRMGRMMRAMADGLQVIAITHLPQVAVMGDMHFKVYKADSSDATYTHVVPLDNLEREQEIARMLSGSEVDEAAILNARSLLNKINR